MSATDLSELFQASSWVEQEPGLSACAQQLAGVLAAERDTIERRAQRIARPGMVAPGRAARHLATLTTARWRWQYGRLPLDVIAGRPLADGASYAKRTIAQVLRDHLAGLGAPAAEIARVIDQSEGLLPGVVVEEVRRRPVTVEPMSRVTVEAIMTRAFGDEVRAIDASPLAFTAVSQLHRGRLADGRAVLVRVRRPGVERALRADARITALLVAPMEALLPAARDMHPLGFVQLCARQALEGVDLRSEALNAIELAMVAEQLGLDDLVIPHPIPGLIDRRSVVFEDPGVIPLTDIAFDAGRTLRCHVGITLESALTHGLFHVDLRPEQIFGASGSRLALVGFATVGRFSIETRRVALKYLTSLISGDVQGQIEAMQRAGAVPGGVDRDALARDLRESEALQPSTLLAGGQSSLVEGLKHAVRILLRHHLRPPIEVTLFVRNVFALNTYVRHLGTDVSLMAALMPLIQRLPQLVGELG